MKIGLLFFFVLQTIMLFGQKASDTILYRINREKDTIKILAQWKDVIFTCGGFDWAESDGLHMHDDSLKNCSYILY